MLWLSKSNKLVATKQLLGLIGVIFLVLSMLSGIVALFPMKLRKLLRPIFSKMYHNIFAITSFVFGMVSIIIGYNTRSPTKSIDPGNMNLAVIGLVAAVLAITLIGPLKTLYQSLRTFFPSDKSSRKSELN